MWNSINYFHTVNYIKAPHLDCPVTWLGWSLDKRGSPVEGVGDIDYKHAGKLHKEGTRPFWGFVV